MWPVLCIAFEAGQAVEPWFERPTQFFDVPHDVGPPPPERTPALDWSLYEDPANAEFWRGPDGALPPAPLLELARDPSAENQARVQAWLERQVKAASDLASLFAEAPAPPEPGPADPPPAALAWREVQIQFIYAARCGFCQRAVPLVAELEGAGARVVPIHLDRPLDRFVGRSQPLAQAARALQAQGVAVSVTPTFVVTFRGRQAVLEGLVDRTRLERVVASLQAPAPKAVR